MPAKFTIGDIVVLKSGGPDMTICSVPERGASHYGCQWFSGKKLEHGYFQAESLKVARPADER